MSPRQVVIQLGTSLIKAGLWEQTFLPTTIIPCCVQRVGKEEGRNDGGEEDVKVMSEEDKAKEEEVEKGKKEHEGEKEKEEEVDESNKQHVEEEEDKGQAQEEQILKKSTEKDLNATSILVPCSLDDPQAIFPIIKGHLVDPKALEVLLYHLLTKDLGLGLPLTDVTMVVAIPASWSRDERYQLLLVLLERLSIGGAYLGESPILASFGCATPQALVVDVGAAVTEVAIVQDGHVLPGAYEMVTLGGDDVNVYLAKLLSQDVSFQDSLTSQAREIFATDHLIIAKLAKEHILSSESTTFYYKDQQWSINKDHLSACFDVLFNPALVSKPDILGLGELVYQVVERCEADRRSLFLDNIILTGGTTTNPAVQAGLGEALARLLPVSDYSGDHQSRNFRIRTVPEYYPDLWQKATPLAVWFGGGITAKCVLTDPRNYYTPADLAQHGSRVFSHK